MIIEKFNYERTDLPDGRIRLEDIRRTYSSHKNVILDQHTGPGLNPNTDFIALYLEGELTTTAGNLSELGINGWAVHIPYTSAVKLLGSKAIEVSADQEFYFFKVGSAPPGTPGYRQTPNEVDKATFANLKRETFALAANIDSTSSTNNILAEMHRMLI